MTVDIQASINKALALHLSVKGDSRAIGQSSESCGHSYGHADTMQMDGEELKVTDDRFKLDLAIHPPASLSVFVANSRV